MVKIIKRSQHNPIEIREVSESEAKELVKQDFQYCEEPIGEESVEEETIDESTEEEKE